MFYLEMAFLIYWIVSLLALTIYFDSDTRRESWGLSESEVKWILLLAPLWMAGIILIYFGGFIAFLMNRHAADPPRRISVTHKVPPPMGDLIAPPYWRSSN